MNNKKVNKKVNKAIKKMDSELRFQDAPWYIKLWRYRHYVPIPFVWTYKVLTTDVDKDLMWRLLVGSAQCDMKWWYTTEEVMERINDNKKTNS